LSQHYGGEVTKRPPFLQTRFVGYLKKKKYKSQWDCKNLKRERERVLLKFRVVKGYEILSLEQTRQTRREEENKQRNQIEISQF
jgi:hypothetical protein